MDDKQHKYILLQDRVGEHIEKGMLMLTSKTVPAQFLRGQILVALPETEQPEDNSQICLTEIEGKGRLLCPTTDVAKLAENSANLLFAITSAEERYRIFRERNRLELSLKINVQSKVLVKVKGAPKEVPGVVWYKGELPTHNGTMFGIELVGKEFQGLGTSNGMFRNKEYFICQDDCGVFVAVDKIRLQEGQNVHSPKKDSGSSGNKSKSGFKSYLPELPSVFSMSKKDKHPRPVYPLRIDQRVVTFVGEKVARGSVRYIAEKPDDEGWIAVGIELDQRMGKGSGYFRNHQRFDCKKDFALFKRADEVIPEQDFDSQPQKQESKLSKDTNLSASLGYYDVNESKSHPKERRRSNSASSTVSISSEEALRVAAGAQGDSTEAICRKQADILAQIKADQDLRNKLEDQGKEVTSKEETIEFEEDHFNKTSTRLNADSYRWVSGRPNIHDVNPVGQDGKSSAWNSDIRQPVAPSSNGYYEVMARGMHRSPVASPMMTTLPGGLYNNSNFITRNEKYYEEIPNFGVSDNDEWQNEGFVNVERTDAVEVHQIGEQPFSPTEQLIQMEPSPELPFDHDLGVGSMVEIPTTGVGSETRYGVIRWVGELPLLKGKIAAGLELEKEQAGCSDGTFQGQRYFTCPAGRGFFVFLNNCHKDSRFGSESPMAIASGKSFGSMESPSITGTVPPPTGLDAHRSGLKRGIQGHHNSCYLDSTLYSMFAFSTVFDTLLHREKDATDLAEYEEVQTVLRNEIVNPLRKHGFVRADRVLKLRTLLDKLGSTSGLTHEEKDPEEFLNTLLQQVLKSESLLQLKSHGNRCEESNYYQIITEKDESIKLATVQRLLEQSFVSADIKLAQVPSCLILQMPRFGNKYKMYDIILPNLTLDITHILENVPRPCSVCGEHASTFECKDCYMEKTFNDNITSLCSDCKATVHKHPDRSKHKVKPIPVPREYSQYARADAGYKIDKHTMELFAVVCIKTSHYVAFVKCGIEEGSEWCFFDSMADRIGEINGYNIPAVTPCPEATKWLSSKPEDLISAMDRGELSPNMKRLFGDAYMCMYQNLDMKMYK